MDAPDWAEPTVDYDLDTGTVTVQFRHAGAWSSELEALIDAEWAVRRLLDVVQARLHEACGRERRTVN